MKILKNGAFQKKAHIFRSFILPKLPKIFGVKSSVARIFIQTNDDGVSEDEMSNISLAKREFEVAVKRGNVKWGYVANHFGNIEVEYTSPEYGAILQALAGNCPKLDKRTNRDALSRMEKENPVLFDKYLEWIARKIVVDI